MIIAGLVLITAEPASIFTGSATLASLGVASHPGADDVNERRNVPPVEATKAAPRRMQWVVIAMFAMTGPTMVAPSRPQSSAPDTGDAQAKPEAMSQQRAARLRDDAYTACEKGQWHTCLERLDEAKALDPAGDTNPRARGWRGTAERRVE
jgi:hypothetical protein